MKKYFYSYCINEKGNNLFSNGEITLTSAINGINVIRELQNKIEKEYKLDGRNVVCKILHYIQI